MGLEKGAGSLITPIAQSGRSLFHHSLILSVFLVLLLALKIYYEDTN